MFRHLPFFESLAVSLALLFSVSAPAAHADNFVGAETCLQCHQEQYQAWQGSHHQRAMGKATSKNVLGDFDNVSLEHYGVKSRFFSRDGKYYVETDNAKGELQVFEVVYTFGYYPLQQYLVAFPGGRYQALTLAWDSRPVEEGGQRWFHLYPDETITHDDELHWTGTYFNWNSRCAECHSTNLRKSYDTEKDSYDTRWSEINVACEACHGPGRAHLDWARNRDGADNKGLDNEGLTRNISAVGEWLRQKGAATAHLNGGEFQGVSGQLAACGSCHSRRALVDDPDLPGNYHDKHQLQLLDPPLYHADGQIRDEVYVLGSFLQSKMYSRGVVCSNCHEPHSLQLRAEGNAVCTQCHSAQVFDTQAHHHHPPGEGSSCANCHMPETTYMVVDPRRDHSFRIPRPDLSEDLGTPNACTGCHRDQSNQWAAGTVDSWLKTAGKTLPPTDYGGTMAATITGAPDAGARLATLAGQGDVPGIKRATALSTLRNFPSREALAAALANLRDPDPLVRIGAIKALEMLPVEQRAANLFPLLKDPIKAVRLEASRLLNGVPAQGLNANQQAALNAALDEYLAALQRNADMPEAQLSLGLFHLARGNPEKAEQAYRRALALSPRSPAAYLNLADLYRELGSDEKGEPLLRQAIGIAPERGAPYHALGLLLVRQKHYAEAENSLARAAELEPDNIRYGYIYAVALDSRGKTAQALALLTSLHQRQPTNPDILYALVDMHGRQGDWPEALRYAEKLQALQPGNPQLDGLIRHLRKNNP